MKLFITIAMMTLSLSAFSQKNLIVKRNQTIKIGVTGQTLLLDTLILNDNATMMIEDDVAAFSLIAKYVEIGNNVTIDGSRKILNSPGIDGKDAPNAKSCDYGMKGNNGTHGSNGADGINFFFYLRIRSIGYLNIIANGASGTSGGKGGNGGNGAEVKNFCFGSKGGDGGDGGNGGNGGNGGIVVFNYTMIDNTGKFATNQSVLNKIQVTSIGGKGGVGGIAGMQGKSTNVNTSIPGKDQKLLNGRSGNDGNPGSIIKTSVKQNF